MVLRFISLSLCFFQKAKICPSKTPGGNELAWKVIKNLLDTDPRGLKEAKKTFKC